MTIEFVYAKKNHLEGDKFIESGKLTEAISSYERSLKFFRTNLIHHDAIKILYKLYLINQSKGNLDNAIKFLGEIIEIQEKLGIEKECIDNYKEIAELYLTIGDYCKAIEYFNKQLEKSKKNNYDLGMAIAYNSIGTFLKNKGNWKDSKKNFENSLIIFKKLGNKGGEAAVLGNLGILEMEQGDWKSALYHLNKDLEITSNIDNFEITDCYINLGLLFSKKGLFDKAIEYYQVGLESLNESEDFDKWVISLNNLGDLLISAGYWEEAKRNLELALDISSSQIVGQYTKLNLFLTMGNLLILEKDFDTAKFYIENAGEITKKIEMNPCKIDYLNKIGKLYLSWHNENNNEECLPIAIIYFIEALKLNKIYEIKLSKGKSLRYIGLAKSKCNKIKESIDSLEESMKILDELGSHYEATCSAIELAKLFFENGNILKARILMKSCLCDAKQYDFKILQIKAYIFLGDIYQKIDCYINGLKVSMFEPKIYKRTCYLILSRIEKEDNINRKIKFLHMIKDINQDRYFECFLNALITELTREKPVSSIDILPDALKKELEIFTS